MQEQLKAKAKLRSHLLSTSPQNCQNCHKVQNPKKHLDLEEPCYEAREPRTVSSTGFSSHTEASAPAKVGDLAWFGLGSSPSQALVAG